MGLVGAGSNNARLAQLLRGLANYYHREANCLFMVRIAQGMIHLGKGTLTLNPFQSDRQVLSRVAIAGLLPVIVSMMAADTCTYHVYLCLTNCSHPWQLSLDIILPDNRHKTTLPDHSRRRIK